MYRFIGMSAVFLLFTWVTTAEADPPPYQVEDFTDPTWSVRFYYTKDGNDVGGGRVRTKTGGGSWGSWGPFTGQYDNKNTSGSRRQYQFLPNDPNTVTDWKQSIYWRDPLSGEIKKSEVYSGNIKKSGKGPWQFYPLADLPSLLWRIPDLGPTIPADPEATIYTAVNLDLYFRENPFGFLGGAWSPGQTLADLGLTITNGVIPGIQGIYWATSEFVFDPDPTGFGFSPTGGMQDLLNSDTYGQDIWIFAEHTPEPTTAALLAIGVLAVRRRGRNR